MATKTHKRCSICGKTKPVSRFHVIDAEKGYYQGRCKPCGTAYYREWSKTPAAKAKAWRHWIKHRYGVTAGEYDSMLAKQKGVCAICQKACSTRARLGVDHDHATGTVRGLLCHKCNSGLARFDEDADRLKRAARYLR